MRTEEDKDQVLSLARAIISQSPSWLGKRVDPKGKPLVIVAASGLEDTVLEGYSLAVCRQVGQRADGSVVEEWYALDKFNPVRIERVCRRKMIYIPEQGVYANRLVPFSESKAEVNIDMLTTLIDDLAASRPL